MRSVGTIGCLYRFNTWAGTHRQSSSGPSSERNMSEFFRSGAIVLMGLTVISAGIAVVFLA